jgi:type II secretory pathway component PulJ
MSDTTETRLRAEIARLTQERDQLTRDIGDALANAPITTGEPQTLGQIVRGLRDRAESAEAEVAEWRDKAKAWMASPEASAQLDGYRDLASRLAASEAEVEQLRALCGEAADVVQWARHDTSHKGESCWACTIRARLAAASRAESPITGDTK